MRCHYAKVYFNGQLMWKAHFSLESKDGTRRIFSDIVYLSEDPFILYQQNTDGTMGTFCGPVRQKQVIDAFVNNQVNRVSNRIFTEWLRTIGSPDVFLDDYNDYLLLKELIR